MVRRSSVLILLVAAASATFGQTTAPRTGGESRAFSYVFAGDGGYLGVQTEEITKDNFSKFGLREVRGVGIGDVVAGSPAQTAGLQKGDVVVSFNGEEVTSVRKLTRLLGEVAPDHQAKLTVLRNGESRDLTVTLGKRPTPSFENGRFALPSDRSGRLILPPTGDLETLPPMTELPQIESLPGSGNGDNFFILRGRGGRQIGANTTPLTKQLAEHFGVAGGVLVDQVRKGSPAEKAGLKAGDIIVEVEGKEVKGNIEIARAIAAKKSGDVELTIVRDRNRQTIRVTPEIVNDGPIVFPNPDSNFFTQPGTGSSIWNGVTPGSFFSGFFSSPGWRWM
jgi:serine protease Do